MKCQSDYDKPGDSTLRQADDCVEEWWDADTPSQEQTLQKIEEQTPAQAIAENEALRRGLVRVDETGELCMSCPEQPTKNDE